MDTKLLHIYNEVLSGLKSKQELQSSFGDISIKTIENKVKSSNSDIVYSKKLGKYHFSNLLPTFISYKFLSSILIDNFSNSIIKDDMFKIQNQLIKNNDFLIETSNLSETLNNLIIFHIAINHNIILSLDYQGNKKDTEEKIIQPNQVIMAKGLYYFYITYDDRNKESIGKKRTFNLNAVSDIKLVEYAINIPKPFKTDVSGNEYGEFDNDRYTLLTFSGVAAKFIKRERLSNLKWDFLNESFDGKSVNIKLYYNSEFELKKLIQQWLPEIKFTEKTELSNKILNQLKNDFSELLSH